MKVISRIVEAHVFRRINNKIDFLLLKRADNIAYGGLWQMVTGKADEGESAISAVKRECLEETGVKPLNLWVVPNVNSFYDYYTDEISLIPVFAVEVPNDCEIKLSKEHVEYKWLEYKGAKKLYHWKGQKKSAKIIYKNFNKLIRIQ